jgi:hypothetical protein
MGKPAARTGDLAVPPPVHIPGTINAACSNNIEVGNQKAMRTVLDVHQCTQTTPPPPGSGPPHGPETCFMGSVTVLYNKQMAVRQGDQIVGFCGGPPNQVTVGCLSVEIGTMAMGLLRPDSIREY